MAWNQRVAVSTLPCPVQYLPSSEHSVNSHPRRVMSVRYSQPNRKRDSTGGVTPRAGEGEREAFVQGQLSCGVRVSATLNSAAIACALIG